MSVEAIAWALKQRVNLSNGKVILFCLANYADDEGRCWPSQSKIADQCEVSLDTVQRRLKEMEDAGLLRREHRHRGDGSRTSDMIVLGLPADLVEEPKPQSAATQPQPAGVPAALVRYHEPSLEPSLEEVRKKELTPLAGGNGKNGHPRKGKNGAYPEGFEALWSAYRPIASPNSTKADALKAWEKLSAEDQDACLAGMGRYVSWLSEEKQRRKEVPAKHLATFINKRGWEPFLEGQSLAPIRSIADEHPDISPERLAEIMESIERDYPSSRRIR